MGRPSVPLNGPFTRNTVRVVLTAARRNTGPWLNPVFERTVVNRVHTMASASVSRHTTPKINGWSYAHNYQRSASLWGYVDGYMIETDKATINESRVMTVTIGYPPETPTPVTALPTTNVGGGPTYPDQNTVNRLIAECKNKVNKRDINLGETLGESRETLKMIAQTASTVLRALLAARKGRFGEALRHLGVSRDPRIRTTNPAKWWLAYHYGWLPLLNDIYAGSELLKAQRKQKKIGDVLSAVRQISVVDPYKRGAATGTITCTYKCKLYYKLSNTTTAYLSSLGLVNPLEVAWALVPFSFVVDWFMPLGTLLQSYTADMGLTFIDGHITGTREISAELVFDKRVNPSKNMQPGSTPARLTLQSFDMQRKFVVTGNAGLYFVNPFSSNHVVTALALLTQLRRG